MTAPEFTEFAAFAMPKLQRLAVALCGGNPHEANDLVQATFERLLLAWPKQRLNDPLAYARKVLLHELASSRRRIHWKRELLTDQAPDLDPATGDIADRISGALTLHAALAKLPPRQRHIVVLRYLEDLSVEQVAELLRCTPGTVKRASHDGLLSLRDRLQGDTTPRELGNSDEHEQARPR